MTNVTYSYHDIFADIVSVLPKDDIVALFWVNQYGRRVVLQNEWMGDRRDASLAILYAAMQLFEDEHNRDDVMWIDLDHSRQSLLTLVSNLLERPTKKTWKIEDHKGTLGKDAP
ncbi:MAG: hypothetical protein IPI58_09695 [Alphaproteobacteria bacterium]|nr:MAG: hypothetical protein IPI58_09695 [Alphaproteobacteria bacterium]